MPFQIQCHQCGRKLKGNDEHRGKKMKCPHCKGVIAVPPAKPNASPPAVPQLIDETEIPQAEIASGRNEAEARQPSPPPESSATPETGEPEEEILWSGRMKKLTGFISSGLLFFFFLIFGIAASSGMKLEFRLFGGRVPTWLPWTFAAFCLLGAIVTLMDYLANKLVITSHRTILYRGGEPIAISHENMGEIVVNTELDVNDTFSPQKHSITIQSLVEGEEAIHLDNASADIAMIQQLLEEVKVSTTRSKQLPGKSGNAPGGLDEIPVLETVSSSASHPARPETQPSPKPIQRSLLLSPEPREDEIVYLRSRFSIHGSAQPCDLFLTDQRLFVVKHSLLSRPVVILQCLLAEMRGVKITETMITCQLSENAKSLVIVKHPLYAIHDPKVLINMLNCALIVGYERKLTKQDDSWVVKRVKMGADKKRKAIEELEESEEYYARVSFMNRVTPRQLILFALYTIGGLLLLVILILIAAGLSSGSKTSVIPQ